MDPLRADRGLRRKPFFWGFVSQAASSATNFGLTLLSGIVLGASGLGSVVIGFTSYLLVLGLQRALITEPLVVHSANLDADARAAASRDALTTSFLLASAATVVLVAVGLVAPRPIGSGILLFAPWIIPALVQDFWRAVLFRDHRGDSAARNDALWLTVMALLASIAFILRTPWAVIGCWGLGAVAGAVAGFLQTRTRTTSPSQAMRWWLSRAWPLGRWLSADFVTYTLGSQTLVFVFAVILGTKDLGGLRAAESVFAPLSLVGPALALPGLPYLSRKVAVSQSDARRAALRLGGVGALIGVCFLSVMFATGGRILSVLFGHSFRSFNNLYWPYGVGQIVTISIVGFGLLLTAQSRGRALLFARMIGAGATLALGIGLAMRFGVVGAAWGTTAGSAVAGIAAAAFALRRRKRRTADPRSEMAKSTLPS